MEQKPSLKQLTGVQVMQPGETKCLSHRDKATLPGGGSCGPKRLEEINTAVHLLASLPDSYNMLVTALEGNVEVPKL